MGDRHLHMTMIIILHSRKELNPHHIWYGLSKKTDDALKITLENALKTALKTALIACPQVGVNFFYAVVILYNFKTRGFVACSGVILL